MTGTASTQIITPRFADIDAIPGAPTATPAVPENPFSARARRREAAAATVSTIPVPKLTRFQAILAASDEHRSPADLEAIGDRFPWLFTVSLALIGNPATPDSVIARLAGAKSYDIALPAQERRFRERSGIDLRRVRSEEQGESL
jgi:hypothetical protein